MKSIKLFLSILMVLFFISNGNAQSAKMVQKAADKVEELNKMLVSVDPAAALSEEQIKQITDLEVKKSQEMRKIKKSDATEEEKTAQKKAFRKEMRQEINKNIFTKEQKQAWKAGKAAKKAAKND